MTGNQFIVFTAVLIFAFLVDNRIGDICVYFLALFGASGWYFKSATVETLKENNAALEQHIQRLYQEIKKIWTQPDGV